MRYTLTRSLYLVALVAFLYGLADGAGILSVYFGGTGSDLSAMTPLNLVKKDTAGGANRWIDAGTTGKGNTGAAGSPTATSPLTFSSGVVACPTCVTGPASTNILFVGVGTTYVGQYAPWGGEATWTGYGTGLMTVRPWSGGFIRNLGTTTLTSMSSGVLQSIRVGVNSPNMTTFSGFKEPPIMVMGGMAAGTSITDYTNSVRFMAGSRIGVIAQQVGSVTSNAVTGAITAEMGLDDGSGIYMGADPAATTITAGSTNYLPPFGRSSGTGFPMVTAGTFSILCGAPASNGTGGTPARMTLQVDEVDSVLYADLGAGVTNYCDISAQTVHVNVGQRIRTKWVNNRTTSITIGGWSAKFVPDSGATVGVIGGENGDALSGTQYWRPGRYTSQPNLTFGAVIVPRAGVVTKGCITTSGTLASGILVRLYKNGVFQDTLLTTTTASGVETQCGSTISVTFAKGDLLAVQTIYTSGNANMDMWGINF